VAEISEKIGETTNNQAEYRAIIAGLKKAKALGAKEVLVRSDSELMVRQVLGIYRSKKKSLNRYMKKSAVWPAASPLFKSAIFPVSRTAKPINWPIWPWIENSRATVYCRLV
jgi:ribonuclease HI